MEKTTYSPAVEGILEQIEILKSVFKTLSVEDYEIAINLVKDFMDTLQHENSVHRQADKELDEDDTSEITSKTDRQTEGRKNRRKRSDPKRSMDFYDSEEEDLDPVVDHPRKIHKRNSKERASGCKVVTDFKGDERFQCEMCDLKFSYYAALLRHLDSVHKVVDANKKIQEMNKKAVTCNVCGSTLSSKGALHAHMLMHTGAQPFSCDVCNKKFSLKSNLLRHKRIHEGLKPYKCDICNKSFTEKRSVEVHRRIHTGEKPYSCEICGLKFSQLGSWMGHRDTHKEKTESSHQCDVCGKKFAQKVGLINHKKRHNDENRHHVCTSCSKTFFSAEEARLHSQTHTREKPYLCAECGKSFSRQQALKNHMDHHRKSKSITKESDSQMGKLSSESNMPYKPQKIDDFDDLTLLPKDVLVFDGVEQQELIEVHV